MKKLLLILLLATASLFSQDITGSGTSGDPYVLYNAADLDSIDILGVDVATFYALGNDIDMTSWGVWTPIAPFYGGFDGRGYTISNLILGKSGADGGPYNHYGLFSTLEGTGFSRTIKKINFLNVSVVDDTLDATNGNFIGVLAGESKSPIYTIDSINVENVSFDVYVKTGEVALIGGLIGKVGYGGAVTIGTSTFRAINVNNIYINQRNSGTGINEFGGMFGDIRQGYGNTSVVRYCSVDSVIINNNYNKQCYAGGFSGFVGANITIYDSYAVNVHVVMGYTGVTIYQAGPFVGYATSDNTFKRCYVVGDVDVPFADTLSPGFVGYTTYQTTADSTVIWCSDSTTALYDFTSGVYDPGNFVGGPVSKTSTEMKDTNNYDASWDFVNIWSIDPLTNYGFPNLSGSRPATGYTLISPNGGEFYTEGDTIPIQWVVDLVEEVDTTIIWLSLDNGASWTLIDSTFNNATTYSWGSSVPFSSLQCLISINNPDSSFSDRSDIFFVIFGVGYIDIYYPIEKSGVSIGVGDTLHIDFLSQFVDSAGIWWTNDSTDYQSWKLISNVAIDTVNNSITDSTTYVWTITADVIGPQIYIKVLEAGDTTMFYASQTPNDLGKMWPHYLICLYNEGGNVLEHFFRWDPSCGWASSTNWYYTRYPDDYGTIITGVEQPTNGYLRRDFVYLIDGVDTIETRLNDFYEHGQSLIYEFRQYFFADSMLYALDLINSDTTLIADLTYWYELGGFYKFYVGTEAMQLYNVQPSKVEGQYLDINTDFENLNDPLFVPKMMLYDEFGVRVLTIDLLPEPNSGSRAEDIEWILTDAAIQRYFFRGIHPKAEKR